MQEMDTNWLLIESMDVDKIRSLKGALSDFHNIIVSPKFWVAYWNYLSREAETNRVKNFILPSQLYHTSNSFSFLVHLESWDLKDVS